jgi:hypothetical protein
VFDYKQVLQASIELFNIDKKYIKKEYLMTESRYGNMVYSYDFNGNKICINEQDATINKLEKIFENENDANVNPIDETYLESLNNFLTNMPIVNFIQRTVTNEMPEFELSKDEYSQGYYFEQTEEEDTECFAYKIRSLVDITKIRKSDFWRAACAVQAYEKYLAYESKKALHANLGYVGVVGENPYLIIPVALQDASNFQIDDPKNTVVMTQTTLSTLETKDILAKFKANFGRILVFFLGLIFSQNDFKN